MTEPTWREETLEHLQEVGLLCTHWAYLEWMLEISVWWFLGCLNTGDPADGQVITGNLNCESLARKAFQLSHRMLSEPSERDVFNEVRCRVRAVVEERNLVVHGRRAVSPDELITATVSRGTVKYKPQPLPLMRIRSLNLEIGRIIDELEPVLVRHHVIKTIAA